MIYRSLLAAILSALTVLTVSAGEYSLMDTANWHSHYPKSRITAEDDGVVSLQNGASFAYTKTFDLDSSQRYIITLEACSDAPKGTVSISFVPYTAEGKQINTENIVCAINSLTEIAEDAKTGDTVVKVRDISKFEKGLLGSCLLAVDAKEDFSDLPNFHLIKVKTEKPLQENGAWSLTLASPLKEPLAAGTPVRQHYYGSAFYFTRGFKQALSGDWETKEAHLAGIASQCSPVKFPRGTAKFKVQIFFNVPAEATVRLRNLKLSVLPK